MSRNKAIALLMEMGTGKTLTSIATFGRASINNKIKKLLIVCPATLLDDWENAIKEDANFEYTMKVLTGTATQKKECLNKLSKSNSRLEIAIINYESSWRILEELLMYHPDMVICDESQRIKNPNSKQSKALHKLGKIAERKMILTGTPVTQNPLDIFSQYKFLDSSIFGESYYTFKNHYAIMRWLW